MSFYDPARFFDPLEQPKTEGDFARLRLPSRTYLSRSFPIKPPSRDAGQSGRFIKKVFDHDPLKSNEHLDWSEDVLVDGLRRQIMLLVARQAGQIKEIKIQKVPSKGDVEDLLVLKRDAASRLLDLVKMLDHLPVEGETGVRLDDDVVEQLLDDPDGVRRAYARAPDQFAGLITEDVTASDVVAIARRRQEITRFRDLLTSPAAFADRQEELGTTRTEIVWQRFLEDNPWVLGVGLGGQLLTSWDSAKMEQSVVGHSVGGAGKRVDALMRTAGFINSMVFAEIKHHNTPLLEDLKTPYRPECWAPSRELAGGVTQIQQTVHRATTEFQERLPDLDDDGFDTGGFTYLIRPRCYLIAGSLGQMMNEEGRVHVPKFRSFELYRRNLYEPQILTFDELLARAEWHLAEAEREAAVGG